MTNVSEAAQDTRGGPLSQHPTVLVVDDEEPARMFLARLLRAAGYTVEFAVDGPSALAAVAKHGPDVVLLDVNIPGLNGFEVCRRLKGDAVTRLTPIVFITALNAPEQRVEGIAAGADDFLSKPVNTSELLARVRSLVHRKQYTDDLDSASSIIITLAGMIESRDGYAEGHCHRMANYATSLGREVGVTDADLQALYRGGFLHDIGMLAIPDPVLRKTDALQDDEMALIRSHPVVGDTLCSNLRSLQSVRPIVLCHHERLDGSGYPAGLKGDDIPFIAQIIGVVDVFEAVTTSRSYREAHSVEEGITVLQRDVDRGWRRQVLVDRFVHLVASGALFTFPLP
jgi:putative two-component system response regulator